MTKVLLMDDDVRILELLKRGLMRSGKYGVVTESKSARLMERAREFGPDIIVLDIAMPDMDGGDVAAELKQDRRTKDIPVIFLSSLVSEKEASRSRERAANEEYYVAKPVTADELIVHIEERLKTNAEHDERGT